MDLQDIPGLILLLDFEKCFDSLEWSFLDKTLAYFNFGSNVRKWIRILYKGAESCIINNGFLSKRFLVERGVRQGDPLSPYLFLLAGEILARNILNHTDINGITIDGSEYLLSQYADDVKIMLNDDEQSILTCFEVLDKFGECSGLRINYNKTVIVTLGRNQDTRFLEDRGLKWQYRGQFTVLGISYNLNKDEVTADNYSKYMKQFEGTLNAWSARNLTLYGRVVVLKSLALSKLVHLFTSLPNPPEHVIKQMQKRCFEFIWANKRDKIKRSSMYNTFDQGGLKVPNILLFIQSLKINWIKRLMRSGGKQWKTIFASMCEEIGGCYMWQITNLNPSFLLKLSPFWRDVYLAWQNLKFVDDAKEYEDDPRRQPLFFNPKITHSGNTFFFKKWRIFGIEHVNDLLREDGSFLSYNEFSEENGTQDELGTNFLDYMAIVHSIPVEWKPTMQQTGRISDGFNETKSLNTVRNLAKPSRYFYSMAINRVATCPDKALGKWVKSFGIEPNEIDWSSILNLQSQVTDETKLWALQLKIIHRILPTNTLLYNYKLKNSPSCTFCEIYKESLEHLFWECKHTKSLWLQLAHWIDNNNIHLKPSLQCIITGGHDHMDVVRHIILITKEFIFQTKLKGINIPPLRSLIRTIRWKCLIEKNYKTAEAFLLKWGPVLDALEVEVV